MRYIKDISDFVFINDSLEKADIIFIPGGLYPEIAEKAADIYNRGFSKIILPSGAYAINEGKFTKVVSKLDIYNKEYKTEWEFLKDVLVSKKVKEEDILKEDKATFTYENAIFSKKLTDSLNLDIKKAIICCKSYHARRCLMYYETLYKDVEFIVCGVDIDNITKNNWYRSEKGIELVLGEFNRYSWQFKDILKDLK